MILRDLARQQVGDVGRDADPRQVDGRDIEHPAHGHRHVLVADHLFVEHQLEQPRALLLLQFQQLLDLLVGQEAVLNQRIRDAFTE